MFYRFMLILTLTAITITSSVLAASVNNENLNAYLTLIKNNNEDSKIELKSVSGDDLMAASIKIRNFERLSSKEQFTRSDYLYYSNLYAIIGEFGNSLQLLKSAQRKQPNDISLYYRMIEISAASNDSTLFVEQVLNIIGRRDLSGLESSIDLAFSELIKRKDDDNLSFILAKTGSRLNGLGPVVEYWHAVTDYNEGKYDSSLNHMFNIIKVAVRLNSNHRQWIINTIPELLFMQSEFKSALGFYQLIATNSDDRVEQDNANKMIARINLLAGNYGAATSETIVDFSVERELAKGLLTLEENGVSYGIDNLYRK